jgi:hypothetical protein
MSGVLTDISNNGNNGTITGALSTKDGMAFQPNDSKVTFTNPGFIADDEITIMTRVRGSDYTHRAGIVYTGDADGQIIGVRDGVLHSYIDGKTQENTDITLINNKEYSLGISFKNGTFKQYIDGVLIYTATSQSYLVDTSWLIGQSTAGDRSFDGEIIDVKIYDYEFTPQQAKDYHNSFIKPTLRETFSDSGADGVATTPREWSKGTGDYKVGEQEETTNILTNSGVGNGDWVDSNSDGLADDWSKDAETTPSIVTGNGFNGNAQRVDNTGVGVTADIFQNVLLTDGLPYVLTMKYRASNMVLRNAIAQVDLPANTGDAKYLEYRFVSAANAALNFAAKSPGDWFEIDEVVIRKEQFFDTGTKYLECDTAGTIATQSKQAYGEWEFDVMMDSATAYYITTFMSSSPIARENGYQIVLFSNGRLVLQDKPVGSANSLCLTDTGYISNNTWYRTKVARLKSEGVFKDIPTLQTETENVAAPNGYTAFSATDKYSFSAVSDGSATQICGTGDIGAITSGDRIAVSFDCKLNSGTLPTMRISETLTSGTASAIVDVVEGRNEVIFDITATRGTSTLGLWSSSSEVDFEISGLQIRRIYPANTFAVFIRGGSYGNTETGWTLADPSGGSGSNPVTDSTYTTSEYLVVDADAGDRITNIITRNEVAQ